MDKQQPDLALLFCKQSALLFFVSVGRISADPASLEMTKWDHMTLPTSSSSWGFNCNLSGRKGALLAGGREEDESTAL